MSKTQLKKALESTRQKLLFGFNEKWINDYNFLRALIKNNK